MPGIGKSVSLLDSAAQTATGQGTAVTGLRGHSGMSVHLDVTAAATEVDDTLDVYVQRLLPDGSTWDDLVHFTQVLGNGSTVDFVADVIMDSSANDERATTQETLGVGTARAAIISDQLRVTWVIVDPGAGVASFTFSVTADLM